MTGQPAAGMTAAPDDSVALHAELDRLARAASAAADPELAVLAATLADLLAAADLLAGDAEGDACADDMRAFVLPAAQTLQQAVDDPLTSTAAQADFRDLTEQAIGRWGDYLDLLADQSRPGRSVADAWTTALSENGAVAFPETNLIPDEPPTELQPGEFDVAMILSQLQNGAGAVSSPSVSGSAAVVDRTPPARPVPVREARTAPRSAPVPLPVLSGINDPELQSAYIDDAQQCLAGMESCLLAMESDATPADSLRQFCRELHTLKGASGTVGLDTLAAYLHDIETSVAETASSGMPPDVDQLLACVDAVRAQLDALTGSGAAPQPIIVPTKTARPSEAPLPTPTIEAEGDASATSAPMSPPASPDKPASAAGEPETNAAPAADAVVRMEASRLDRLMDLLAELVMLRNRRDTHVASLRRVLTEVSTCATRIRMWDSQTASGVTRPIGPEGLGGAPAYSDNDRLNSDARRLSRSLGELSNDVLELGRSLQQMLDPLALDNQSITHLIGRFRQELMELRRLPVSGLMQKLTRAARDAARLELKRVEVVVIGQGTRAERSLQERLFEPLMHIVRNAVSHGIEAPDRRISASKPPVGKITIEAWSDASTLTIEVRDDGRGLDEPAIERRGRELGLLPHGEPVTREKLWKLIFQPGFSTRREVNAVAGRGVGMDVVASWVRQLRGRVDLESTPGQGATVRLSIPLRSAIEHALIVRIGGQLFALPLPGIDTASLDLSGRSPRGASSHPRSDRPQAAGEGTNLRQLLGLAASGFSDQKVLYLRPVRPAGGKVEDPAIAQPPVPVMVDGVVGVEEVVVRGLPPLLQGNELFSGVTLSGQSETVLLFDVSRLVEAVQRTGQVLESERREHASGAGQRRSPRERILIVDDSVSVRRTLVRRLQARGWQTVEAGDGLQALELLRAGGISALTTDLDMPRLSGLDLLAEVKQNPRHRDLPVIVISSRDDAATHRRLAELGADRVLSKPVTDETILEILNTLQPAAV